VFSLENDMLATEIDTQQHLSKAEARLEAKVPLSEIVSDPENIE
jgi:hypothetical protein